jgi:hypothetical protein
MVSEEKVPCAGCGHLYVPGKMQACARCGDWLCQRCAAVEALCPRCREDESLTEYIL